MDRGGNGFDLTLKHATGRRVGHHQAGSLWPNFIFQRLKVYVAFAVDGHLSDLVTAHHSGSWIRSVGRGRHNNFRASVISSGFMVSPYHGNPGKLTLSTRHRRQGNTLHACHVFEDLLQIIHTGQVTLARRFRRQRVTPQKPRHARRFVRSPWVVLHGAGAQGIEHGIDRKILLRQVGVVPYRLQFGDLRQSRCLCSQQVGWNIRQTIGVGAIYPLGAGSAVSGTEFKNRPALGSVFVALALV